MMECLHVILVTNRLHLHNAPIGATCQDIETERSLCDRAHIVVGQLQPHKHVYAAAHNATTDYPLPMVGVTT